MDNASAILQLCIPKFEIYSFSIMCLGLTWSSTIINIVSQIKKSTFCSHLLEFPSLELSFLYVNQLHTWQYIILESFIFLIFYNLPISSLPQERQSIYLTEKNLFLRQKGLIYWIPKFLRKYIHFKEILFSHHTRMDQIFIKES